MKPRLSDRANFEYVHSALLQILFEGSHLSYIFGRVFGKLRRRFLLKKQLIFHISLPLDSHQQKGWVF